MGAYLLCRVVNADAGSVVDTVNEWLKSQPEYEKLTNCDKDRSFTFWDEDDLQWARKHIGENHHKELGEARIKTSGLSPNDSDQCPSLWTELFRKLHNNFDIEVYSKSCSLHPSHFTADQVRIITNGGDALTGEYQSLDELFEAEDFPAEAK